MTNQDIQAAKESIKEYYASRGGLPEMFDEFMSTLSQSNEFGINESYVTNPVELAGQWFCDRYTAKGEKTTLADIVASIAEKDGNLFKTYNYFTKQYE